MAYQNFDFTKQGVPAPTAKALQRRFSSWEELAAATPEQLLEVPGVSNELVDDLRDTAIAQIGLAKRQEIRVEERVSRVGEDSSERLFVLSEKPADLVGGDGSATPRNIKRRRKLLVPSICPVCGIDFAERKGVSWDLASAITKDELAQLVKAHVKKVHDLATQRILTEAQMKTLGIGQEPQTVSAS